MVARHGSRNFVGSRYKLATTDLNKYFPVYITFERDRANDYSWDGTGNEPHNKLAELTINDVYLYRKPERLSLQTGLSIYKDYPALLSGLLSFNGTIKFRFLHNDIPHYLNIMRGYIADSNDNILLLLTTKEYNVFDNTPEHEIRKNPLRLYISTEFMKNEIYKNVYKRIEKEYIDECYKEDVEVVFTTSEKIENNMFRNNFNVEFNNISELSEILLTEPHDILDYNFDLQPRVPNNIQGEVEEELPF